MSRATEFQMAKASNLSPNPNQYDPKVTSSGDQLLGQSPSLNEQLRGTFGKDDRFKGYKNAAYIRSNP